MVQCYWACVESSEFDKPTSSHKCIKKAMAVDHASAMAITCWPTFDGQHHDWEVC